MTPTTWRPLAALFGIALALGFVVLRVVGASDGSVPKPPLLVGLTVAFIAAGVLITAVVLRPRLQRRPGAAAVQPLIAARLVALAFASSRAGALLCGLYTGWFLAALATNGIDTAFARSRLWSIGLAALASAVLVGAGLLLERACRVRPDDGEGS